MVLFVDLMVEVRLLFGGYIVRLWRLNQVGQSYEIEKMRVVRKQENIVGMTGRALRVDSSCLL